MDITTEISLMDQRLSIMEDKLSHVENKLDSMDVKLNQIAEALTGNPYTSDKGLVGKLDDIKEKVDDHDESLKRIKWFWLGVVAVGSIVGYLVSFLFSQ